MSLLNPPRKGETMTTGRQATRTTGTTPTSSPTSCGPTGAVCTLWSVIPRLPWRCAPRSVPGARWSNTGSPRRTSCERTCRSCSPANKPFRRDRLCDHPHVPRAVHHPSPGRLALAQTRGRLVVLGVLQRSHRSQNPAHPSVGSTTGNYRHRGSNSHRDHAGVRAILRSLHTKIEALASSIGEQLAIHPDAHIVTSLPRSGTVRAARLLAEIGDARGRSRPLTRWPASPASLPRPDSPARSRPSPSGGEPTKSSDAICDFAGDSRRANPWAADLYAKARARGHDHPHAVRILARPGYTSSGAPGKTTPPTTPPSTEPSKHCSTTPPEKRPNQCEVDTGQLIVVFDSAAACSEQASPLHPDTDPARPARAGRSTSPRAFCLARCVSPR